MLMETIEIQVDRLRRFLGLFLAMAEFWAVKYGLNFCSFEYIMMIEVMEVLIEVYVIIMRCY